MVSRYPGEDAFPCSQGVGNWLQAAPNIETQVIKDFSLSVIPLYRFRPNVSHLRNALTQLSILPEIARNIVREGNGKYIMLDQFNNAANVNAHYNTTGPEMILEVPQITHFVAGMGTGGTLMGVGKRLKEYKSSIQVIGIEPLPNSKIQGLRNMKAYTPQIYQEDKLDSKLIIEDDDAA